MSPDRSVTPRGFQTYDTFTDSYGSQVVIRESSAAGAPHVWIFITYGLRESTDPEAAAHLTTEQAVRVRDALDVFIRERGE